MRSWCHVPPKFPFGWGAPNWQRNGPFPISPQPNLVSASDRADTCLHWWITAGFSQGLGGGIKVFILEELKACLSRSSSGRVLLSSKVRTRQAALMGVNGPSNTSGILDGIHGVQLVGRSAFEVEKALHCKGVDRSTCRGVDIAETSQILLIRRIWQQRPSCLRPIRCTLHGDRNITESVANVLTSLPFVVLGLQVPRKNINTALYANSLIGVGIASSLYHSSRGVLRKYLRWADYTMIAATTLCLSRSLRNENPKLLMAASTLLLPIQPLMVSAVHTGLMEATFAKQALTRPNLRMAHNLHKMSSLLGAALFIADDCFPQTPYLHAAWHLAAAVGVGTCNKLLE
ncbi:uncharacterized protein LOC135617556 isoform X1 [Musa acuminata AAA Group]|uniref:uncharacterized protein LOC135617556 isoform X1 n=1 Tax=Musa acuminata AAA Group TaxID=214697 RepID=UPI0031D0D985